MLKRLSFLGISLFLFVQVIFSQTSLQAGSIAASIYSVDYNTSPGKIFETEKASSLECIVFGQYRYTWQKSYDNLVFTDVYTENINPGLIFTKSEYDPGNLTQHTYFRRAVICSSGTLYSNVILIKVNPLKGGSLSIHKLTIQTNSTPGVLTANPASGGNCGDDYRYQWMESSNGVDFFPVADATSATYDPGILSTTRYYKRKVRCGTDEAYTNVCTIEISSVSAPSPSSIRLREYSQPGIYTISEALQVNNVAEVKQGTQYFDGLGRLIQTVSKQGALETGSNAKDLVATSIYDEYGRESVKYLPYVSIESNGFYKVNAIPEQVAFNQSRYTGEKFFYSHIQFEMSPLSRVGKVAGPGESWTGSNRGVEARFWNNTETDVVRIWKVNDNNLGVFGTYSSPETYESGKLFKKATIDENGKQVIEFTNKHGKTVLKKVQLKATGDNGSGANHSDWLCTYYVYDNLDLLRAVIQPKAVDLLAENNWQLTDELLKELCFRYEYDQRGRMIIKQVPGAAPINMVYDARDRLVMMQDGNMRANKQWMYIQYDPLNRPRSTGIFNDPGNYNNPSYHRELAYSRTDYPLINDYTYEELTRLYYDNYAWTSSLTTGLQTFDNSFNAAIEASNIAAYPEILQMDNQATGLVTGVQTKVLGTANQFITKVNFYDKKGRVIQTKIENITQGIDVATTLYNFDGAVLIGVLKQQKSGINPQIHEVWTRFSYDDLGRVSKVEKRLRSNVVNNNNYGNWVVTTQNDYDVLGQMKKKRVGNKQGTSDGSEPLANLDYEYNIRGWLLSINKDYLDNGGEDRYFGLQLGYDKNGVQTFAKKQYNGNISGTIWKSAGDEVKRKYDFYYDAANRLLKADFSDSKNFDFNVKMGDGSDPLSAYDANGNIKRMQQWGIKGATSLQIDDLSYSYYNNGNKLQAVTELNGGSADNKLGDFIDKNITISDYGYDLNGNMITDLNKRLDGDIGTDQQASGGAIAYNHLNLPMQVNVKDDDGVNRGGIRYVYDAAGVKLQKITTDNSDPNKSITSTITYLEGFVYESKIIDDDDPTNDYTDVLQLISHEEGRIRFEKESILTCTVQSNRFVFDYFIRDHLGNTRAVLTEQQEDICYRTATLEETERTKEKAFYNINDGQVTDKTLVNGATAFPQFNQNLYQVHGGIDGKRTGLGFVLKVMSGDKIKLTVQSIYTLPGGGGIGEPAKVGLTELLTAFALNPAIVSKGGNIAAIEGLQIGTGITDFLNQHTEQPNRAKAYLNYMLFDEQFKFLSGDIDPVEENGGYKFHDKFINDPIQVNRNGYLYIYVSNESNLQVFFDNLTVVHTPGPILEETHYYPFGLSMAGISTKAIGRMQNQYNFNGGIELNRDFDIDLYETRFRGYDVQIGRFGQIDPLSDKYQTLSPYLFAFNNPISFNDPLGLEPPKFKDSQELLDYLINYGISEFPNGFTRYQVGRGGSLSEPYYAAAITQNGGGVMGVRFTYSGGGAEGGYYDSDGYKVMTEFKMVTMWVTFNSFRLRWNEYQDIKESLGKWGDVNFGLGLLAPYEEAFKYINTVSNGRVSPALSTFATDIRISNSIYNAGRIVKGLGYVGNGIGVVTALYQVVKDPSAGNYTRLAVQGIAIAATTIPVAGWAVSLGIGIADYIWGDDFYEWVDKKVYK